MESHCFNCRRQFTVSRAGQLFCSPKCRYRYYRSDDMVLTLKKQWFDMILSGVKTEEYREIKPYWEIRFENCFGRHWNFQGEPSLVWNNQKKTIKFRNGYGNDKPEFTAECTIREDCGKEEWGAEPGKKYYVLTICEIIGTKNIPNT